MSMLERAVVDLADALDTLESKITETLAGKAESAEIGPAMARHLRTAGERAEFASSELTKAIDDLKLLIGDNDGAEAKNDG